MPVEAVYFPTFLYTLSVLWGLALLFFFARWLVCSKRAGAAAVMIGAAIAVDLALFAVIALPVETLERKQVRFSEKHFAFSFPVRRNNLPFLDKRFRYFISSTQNNFSAFDSVTIDKYTPVSDKKKRNVNVTQMLGEIRSGRFALHAELRQMNTLEFIELGRLRYAAWDRPRRAAYLGFLELVCEDLLFQGEFYDRFADGSSLLMTLAGDIDAGYFSLRKNVPWPQKDETAEIFSRLIKINLHLRSGAGPAGTGVDSVDVGNIAGATEYHRKIYERMSALEHFMYLLAKYRIHAVHTFVRFRDFDAIAGVYDRASADLSMNNAYQRLCADLALEGPLIRFFPAARMTRKGAYVAALKKSEIEENILYVEPSGRREERALQISDNHPVPTGEFSYQVRHYDPNRLALSYASSIPGFLYFSDGYDRYWRAALEGKGVAVLKANGAFKAIKVPAGTHQVEFRYDPFIFTFSLGIYYLVTAGCVIFLAVEGIRRARAAAVSATRKEAV
ncbi:MAG: YfhO family protein [Candidatus Omnitrophota bacterium]